ncbi:MAG: pyridoxal phosphate-dependent aminotransferase [candidate division Zixibacteria bacterium]|nr:pyridoxal phosphate-dependent aminotransferase [candidate division Zixibacteria bacterium]
MKITKRVVVSAAERIQQLPAPFLSELQGLCKTLERRGKEIVDLGKYAIHVPLAAQTSVGPSDGTAIAATFADYLAREYQIEIDPMQEILLVPGVRAALLLTAAHFVDAGTTCFLPDPGYDAYRKLVLLFEGKPRSCPIYQRNDYLPNLEQFERIASKSPRLLFLTSPHNPTGAVCDENFYSRLQRLAAEANILVVADSSYALSYSGNFRPPLFCQSRKRLRLGIEMFSFSTNLAAPQLKLTAIVGRKRMIDPLATLARSLGLLPSGPLLTYAAPYFASAESLANHISRCREEISLRMNVIVETLQSAGIEFYPAFGAGFVWVKLRRGRLSVAFARGLLRHRGILVAPGTAFGEEGEGWIRIAANVESDRLREVMTALVRAYQPIKSRLHRRTD